MQPEQLHADAVTVIKAWLRQRAVDAVHGPGEWRNPAIRDRMVAVIEATAIRSHHIGVITAATPDTADGWSWHYIARDALTAAADRLNIRDYRITPDNDHTYRLTWH